MGTDWDQYRGKIYSRKGGWTMGQGIQSHGYSLLDEIHGKATMTQLMIMNITGSLPEARLAQFVDGFFICLSWPDTRIWCNKIGVFSALTRSSITAAIAAGGLAGDSKIYGAGTARAVSKFVDLAYQQIIEKRLSIKDFFDNFAYERGKLKAPGFARPLAKGDERIPAMTRLARKLGYKTGTYMQMVTDMEAYLVESQGEGMNLAGYFTAFMKDQGFSVDEIEGIAAFAVSGGVYAAYFEYINQSPNSFLPLRVNDIEYIGPEARKVPKRM
jgi:citrate synthase